MVHTSSEYAFKCNMEWANSCRMNNWTIKDGSPAKNRDVFEHLVAFKDSIDVKMVNKNSYKDQLLITNAFIRPRRFTNKSSHEESPELFNWPLMPTNNSSDLILPITIKLHHEIMLQQQQHVLSKFSLMELVGLCFPTDLSFQLYN